MTVSANKILTTAIEQVRRAMQDAPECTARAVPKLQAIQALVPEIHQMQSKGYDWKAIASLLSEHGIAINVVTLKSYLQRVKAGGVRPAHKRRAGTQTKQRTPLRSGKDTGGGTPEAAKAQARGKTETAPAAPSKPPKQAAPASKAASAPVKDAARPWSFVPEEDTDDI